MRGQNERVDVMSRVSMPFRDGPVPLSDEDRAMMESGVNLAAALAVEPTVFEACVSAVSEASDDLMSFEGDCAVVRTVIQTIIDLTQSPRTVDELTRILLNEASDVRS